MTQIRADQELALSYASKPARAGLEALLALDDTLGRILRTTREAMVGQLRLTWWFEALERLDREPPPAEPVLRALAAEVLHRGVTGAFLAGMIDGWEILLSEDAPDEQALETFARERGGRLFQAMAMVAGAGDEQIAVAGEGWALADLAGNLSDAALRVRAKAMASNRLRAAFARRWSREGRFTGALALLARFELEERGGPIRRVGRLLFHKATGR